MIERLAQLVNHDPAIVRWGRHMNETFMVEVGDDAVSGHACASGRIEKVEKGPFVMRSWRFAIRARREHWEKFWQKPPAPGWHDLFALLRRGEVAFEGDQRVLMALSAVPQAGARRAAERMKLEPIVGRYAHIELDGSEHRLYFEEAGQGIPLICLHTAGSDGRQYRAVLNDAAGHEELPRHRFRHAVARQVFAARGLGEGGLPPHDRRAIPA